MSRPLAFVALAVVAVTTLAAAGPLPTPVGTFRKWVTARGEPCANGPETACEYRACKDEPFVRGTVYYYCDCRDGSSLGCVAGKDSNRGTEPRKPRRTIGSANALFEELGPGDTIAFCRGGVFEKLEGRWWNGRARAGRPVVIRDYAPSCAGSACVMVWGKGDEPRPVIPGNWQFSSGGEHRHQEGIHLQSISSSESFFFNDTDDVRMCNMEFRGGANGTNIGTCNGGTPGSPECSNERIEVLGSRYVKQSGMGWLGSGSGAAIVDSYFYDCGSKDMLDHPIYLGGDKSTAGTSMQTDQVIRGNEIHPPAGTNGTAIVVHGRHARLVIEDNRIVFDLGRAGAGGWGVALRPGYSGQGMGEVNVRAVVRGNVVIDSGNLGIEVDACQECLVENNVVTNRQQPAVGIRVPDPKLGCESPDCEQPTYTIVRNNTVHLSAGGSGIESGGGGSGYVVVNNAVEVNGICYVWDGDTRAYALRDHNLSHNCKDRPVGAASMKADPRWMAPGSDYRPTADSPLVAAGDPRQRPDRDRDGVARPTAPSIGAHEP